MAFLDKSGILAEPAPEPAKILLFQDEEAGQDDVNAFGTRLVCVLGICTG